jgi:hypothetical protein
MHRPLALPIQSKAYPAIAKKLFAKILRMTPPCGGCGPPQGRGYSGKQLKARTSGSEPQNVIGERRDRFQPRRVGAAIQPVSGFSHRGDNPSIARSGALRS